MTKLRPRLIQDFLLPALNNETYGELLKWVDPGRSVFSMRWSHKNAATWTLADAKVFRDWDILKGHFKPDMKNYYMLAKQRFRAALYKLPSVEQLPSKDKHIKYYKLRLDIDRKREAMSGKVRRIAHKRANQKCIPTPVLCKNTYGKGTELVGRDYVEESSSCSSSSTSPSLSIKSEDCDQAQDLKIDFSPKDYLEYQQAIVLQRALSGANRDAPSIKAERTRPNSTVLRESPKMNVNSKTPHVPAQAVPVYSNSPLRQAVEWSPVKRVMLSSPAMKIMYKNQTVEKSQPRVESPIASSTRFSPADNMDLRDLESSAIHLLANWSNPVYGKSALRQAVEWSPVKRVMLSSPAMKIMYKNQTVENSQPRVESPIASPTRFSPADSMDLRDLESSAIHLLANWSNPDAMQWANQGDVQRPNPDVRSNRDVVRLHNPDGFLNLM